MCHVIIMMFYEDVMQDDNGWRFMEELLNKLKNFFLLL